MNVREMLEHELEDLVDELKIDVSSNTLTILDKATGIKVSAGKRDLFVKSPGSTYYYMDTDKCDFAAHNPGMVWLKRTGFMKDGVFEGFLSHNYVDFLEEFKLSKFQIGKVKVEVREPSALFKVLFNYRQSDKLFMGWKEERVLKLSGVTPYNYEDYIGMACFYLNKYSPSPYDGIFPEIATVLNSYEGYSSEGGRRIPKANKFKKLKYPEVTRFYNKATMAGGDEVSVLYYYKVLEYFFNIARKDEFVRIVNKYVLDKNADELLSEASRFYSRVEIDCLRVVLGKLNKKTITKIIGKAFEEKLLKDASLESLAKLVYQYRNQIAHGKKDGKLDIYIPTICNHAEFSNVVKIMRDTSWSCIRKFCL